LPQGAGTLRASKRVRFKVAVGVRREWGADSIVRAFIGELSFSRTRLSALLTGAFNRLS